MSPARRSRRKQDWPRGLYEPRPGYFTWRHPDGRTIIIGRVPLAVARNDAMAANQHVADTRPGLVEKISGGGQTVVDLLEKMDVARNSNTAKANRSIDKKIRAAMDAKPLALVSTMDCANLVESEAHAGKGRSAQALRSRLIGAFSLAVQLGWIEHNPALPTRNPKAPVRRGRLTLDLFKAIYAKAEEVAEWLPLAMRLAVVTGADRSTIAGLQRSDVADGYLTITRPKTGVRVAIPTGLRLECLGWTLADVVAHRTGVVSRYIVHHVNPWGNAPAGSRVHPDRISHAFTESRKLAGISNEAAPTFHELRSLAKRLYNEQGNVDTKALLGHATERMSDLYANPRGVESIRVNVNAT